MKYGNVAIDASNKMGMKSDELKKANQKSKKHPMPNANVKMNKAALEEAERLENGDYQDIDFEESDFEGQEFVDIEE